MLTFWLLIGSSPGSPCLACTRVFMKPYKNTTRGIELLLKDLASRSLASVPCVSETIAGMLWLSCPGLTCVVSFELRPFNFWVYPRKYRSHEPYFSVQASSFEFLAQN